MVFRPKSIILSIIFIHAILGAEYIYWIVTTVVGETGTTICSRMKHHRNASKTYLNRLTYDHIRSHNEEKLDIYTFMIIDQVTDVRDRKEKEMYYIDELKTKVPFSLNIIRKYLFLYLYFQWVNPSELPVAVKLPDVHLLPDRPAVNLCHLLRHQLPPLLIMKQLTKNKSTVLN